MKNKSTKEILSSINADIVTLIKLTSDIGWDRIRKLSIYRILYLSSVLYSFKNPGKENPFIESYHFDIDSTGPYCQDINNSLTFLESNEYLKKDDNTFTLNTERLSDLADLSQIQDQEKKEEWLKTIIHILGIYGENKIYDFVIRDPQYQDHIARNVPKELNIDMDNKTIEVLNSFKGAFEKTLGKDAEQIDDKEYLELYFEYVFSKVLKGDIEL